MKAKNFITIMLSAFLGAAIALGAHYYLMNKYISKSENTSPIENVSFKTVGYSNNTQPVNFTYASSVATPAVVHVTTTIKTNPNLQAQEFYGNDLFEYFFGNPRNMKPQEQKASGSGVVISKDGYIITNNHVIDEASDIEVSLSNNKTYKATLIGKDKDTDLALIKIEEDGLPYLNFANSDSVLVGEWVLAVGNPFNLESTVTAGIVSAKGRNINLLENGNGQSNTAIESFIQTDAAINPGNSGGALINTQGDLIGINTAIASLTGSYAGYGFAVPSNIAAKVVSDIKEFGTVQRAFLGVNIQSVDQTIANKLKLKEPKGVYLQNVNKGGAADEAGLKDEDVIVGINGQKINNIADLQEKIASFRPGNVIEVSYLRNNSLNNATITLKNKFNSKELVNNSDNVLKQLGLQVSDLNKNELFSLGLKNGIVVDNINKDGLVAQVTDMKAGFVISSVNDQAITSVETFKEIISAAKGKVLLEGKYPKNQNTFLYALILE